MNRTTGAPISVLLYDVDKGLNIVPEFNIYPFLLSQIKLIYDFLGWNNYPDSPHSQGGMKFATQISPLLNSDPQCTEMVLSKLSELPTSRGSGRARPFERMLGDNLEQGSGTSQVEEGSAFKRKEFGSLRSYLSHHSQRQVRYSQRRLLWRGGSDI